MVYMFTALRVLRRWNIPSNGPDAFRYRAISVDSKAGPSEEEQVAGRQWLATFNPSTIPRRLCQVTYSRASGPGGQKVNK